MSVNIVAVYVNVKFADKYTLYTGNSNNGLYECLCCDDHPTHPLGVSMFSQGELGIHNGNQIDFNELPVNVQQHAIERLSNNPKV